MHSMSNKESLRTFIYREAGSDAENRISLLKYLAPLMRLNNVDSDAGTELDWNDGGYEDVQLAKYSEAKLHPNGDFMPEIRWQLSEKDMLVGHVVRSYNHSVQEGSAYPLLKRVAVHLRQMIADELEAVDFDGIVRHAYILDEHKPKWDVVANSWRQKNLKNQAAMPVNQPRQRSQAQDEEIITAIKKLGHDPKALPKNQPGRPGVKNAVRQQLSGSNLFVGKRVFDIAWERMSKAGDIAYGSY
jgi:hypothetical protein